MLWAAFLLHSLSTPPSSPPPDPSPRIDADGLAVWALRFTPRVALIEDAVVMEVADSARLFGGKRPLAELIRNGSRALGIERLSWAPTSLAALALARAGIANGFARPLATLLDGLPLESVSAVAAHAATLERIGCRTLGQVRALPRGGISRRFDKALLLALDQAYGLRAEAHSWVTVPDTFSARLELMSRVDTAPALLFGARRLLLQMCNWLAARRSGTTAFTLRWSHDAMRSRDAGAGGEMTVHTATAMRNVEHLTRLLSEHLAKVQLAAPVGDLQLLATQVELLEEDSASLLPDKVEKGERLDLVLERIEARLGAENVLRPVQREDHRIEWMTHWHTAIEPRPRTPTVWPDTPLPTFLLEEPLPLATNRYDQPLYQGPLQLLLGPDRVEGGWWHRITDTEGTRAQNVTRDYWVALSEHAGLLWVFQSRLDRESSGWFLHGLFA